MDKLQLPHGMGDTLQLLQAMSKASAVACHEQGISCCTPWARLQVPAALIPQGTMPY